MKKISYLSITVCDFMKGEKPVGQAGLRRLCVSFLHVTCTAYIFKFPSNMHGIELDIIV